MNKFLKINNKIKPFKKKITIEVPASTGNVGPGFDCIGLAVDIWNKVTIEKSDGTFEILNQGISKEKYDSIPIKENLITKGILLACPEIDLNKFKIISENNIPFAGGLGSSAASISAGLIILGGYMMSSLGVLALQ